MAIKLRGRPLPRWGYHSGECRGEAGTGAIMRGRGWRAVFCFFLRNPVACSPFFFGDRFSVPHGDSVRHPFGIRGRAEPAGACAPPTGGEGTILSHNLLNYVNFIPRKVAAKYFPPMPGICAIRCNRVPRIRNQKKLYTSRIIKTNPSPFLDEAGFGAKGAHKRGEGRGRCLFREKTSGAIGEKRSHPS